jgi:hypothetical protein
MSESRRIEASTIARTDPLTVMFPSSDLEAGIALLPKGERAKPGWLRGRLSRPSHGTVEYDSYAQ